MLAALLVLTNSLLGQTKVEKEYLPYSITIPSGFYVDPSKSGNARMYYQSKEGSSIVIQFENTAGSEKEAFNAAVLSLMIPQMKKNMAALNGRNFTIDDVTVSGRKLVRQKMDLDYEGDPKKTMRAITYIYKKGSSVTHLMFGAWLKDFEREEKKFNEVLKTIQFK
jgi:hypothetical protein